MLRPGGSLLIKTIAPADAAVTLPYRLFPTMAAAQRARLPEIVMITDWATAAGFTELVQERVVRDRLVDAARLAATVRADVEIRYPDLPADELGRGLRSLEELATWHLGWSEPRTTTLVRAIVG